MLTVDQLTATRYKVIATAPVLPFKVGEIYDADFVPIIVMEKQTYVRLDLYPHLFKKLQWWEERKVEDINSIKYIQIKIGSDAPVFVRVGDNPAWNYFGNSLLGVVFKTKGGVYIEHITPATENDYQNYIKTEI